MDFQSSANCELKTLNSPQLKRNFAHGHWTRNIRYSHHRVHPFHTGAFLFTLCRLGAIANRLRFAFVNTSIVWQKLLCQLHMPRDCDCDYDCDFQCRYKVPASLPPSGAPKTQKIMPKTWEKCKLKKPQSNANPQNQRIKKKKPKNVSAFSRLRSWVRIERYTICMVY